jgi:hypothetical protein
MRGGLIAFIPVWVIVLVLGISLWVRAGMPVPGPPPPNGNATAYEPACVPSDNPAQLTLCDSGSTVRAPVHSWVRTQLFQPCMEWADAQSSDWRVLIGAPARQLAFGSRCPGTRGTTGSFFASRPGTVVLSAYGYELNGGKRLPYRWSVTVTVGAGVPGGPLNRGDPVLALHPRLGA